MASYSSLEKTSSIEGLRREIQATKQRIEKKLGLDVDGNTISCHAEFKEHLPPARDRYTFFVSFIVPVFAIVPIYWEAWWNPCWQYTSLLIYLSLGLFGGAWFFSSLHIWIYNCVIDFCTPTQRILHRLHVAVFFLAMGASLGFYQLYVYQPNFGYLCGYVFYFLVAIVEYLVSVWQRHQLRGCDHPTMVMEQMDTVAVCKVKYGSLFTFLAVMMLLSFLGHLCVSIYFSPQIISDVRNNVTCFQIP